MIENSELIYNVKIVVMYKQSNFKDIKFYSISKRKSKVGLSSFSKPGKKNLKLNQFINNLPDILKGKELREVIDRTVNAYRKKKIILIGLGAHVIKCGLSPWLIYLMKNKVVNGLALNGAGIVHDFEIAYAGRTSEDVDKGLERGEFGLTYETASIINEAISEVNENEGIGLCLGRKINELNLKYKKYSLLAQAYKLNIPVSVHVAIGTDVVHVCPQADGSKIGQGSMVDFKIFCNMAEQVLKGGVYFNLGSAVILPEVFLKAVSVANNKKVKKGNFTTVNVDMVSHYRPLTNVVKRPTQKKGKGYNFIGHHEIMIPLIFQGILEKI